MTGMFTHRMYVLDPKSGRFTDVAIPVPNANPRAVEIDADAATLALAAALEGVPGATVLRTEAGGRRTNSSIARDSA